MKAVVYDRYGPPDVLQISDVVFPEPADNQVLVKVYATTVNRTDNATTKAIPAFARLVTGIFKPRKSIPGTEFSGEIVSTGSNVNHYKAGDRVFGFYDMGCSAQAEYLVIDSKFTRTIPDGVDFSTAAASIEGAHYAYSCIRKVKLRKNSEVLVYGASGAIGSAAVQLLKYFDMHVTAVVSARHVDLLKRLGADNIIDYETEDFTLNGKQYDFIYDSVGKISFFKCFRSLKRGGIYESSDLGFMGQNIFLPSITRIIRPLTGFRRTIFPFPHAIPDSLDLIETILASGQFSPVIDRHYSLDEIVEAYRYVERGQKTGNVVIDVIHR